MQRSWKVAVAVPMGALIFQGLTLGSELGGACVFRPRPAAGERAAVPAVVRSWEPAADHGSSGEPHSEGRAKVQLVSDHREPPPAAHREARVVEPAVSHAAPAPAVTMAPAAASPLLRNVLTNEGIATMAQAGYTERFITDMIHRKQTKFDVSPAGLAWLAQMGLTERIVRAMVANERKEDDTAILPGYLSIGPEVELPVAPRAKGGRAQKRQPEPASPRIALPVTIQTPSEYWYSRGQTALTER